MKTGSSISWCVVRVLVFTALCGMVLGCGRKAPPLGLQFEACGSASVWRNLAALSNRVEAVCRAGGEVPRDQAENLAASIAGVQMADVTCEELPISALRAYVFFIHSSARLLRDFLPPDIVVGMLLDVRTRVLCERERMHARILQWHEHARDTVNVRGRGDPLREDRLRPRIELGGKFLPDVLRVNDLHEIDNGILVDLDELIERKAIPYYTFAKAVGADVAETLRERFRKAYGRFPNRRPLWWK